MWCSAYFCRQTFLLFLRMFWKKDSSNLSFHLEYSKIDMSNISPEIELSLLCNLFRMKVIFLSSFVQWFVFLRTSFAYLLAIRSCIFLNHLTQQTRIQFWSNAFHLVIFFRVLLNVVWFISGSSLSIYYN